MITALAAETLSVSLLAWMPLAASVSLSALLTMILLPAAILRARQSPLFAATTLAMLAMVWRGEAWKTVFLQSEQQVLELQQPQEQRVPSKPKYLTLALLPVRDDSHCASRQFLDEEVQEDRR
jgi:hypothetical protein